MSNVRNISCAPRTRWRKFCISWSLSARLPVREQHQSESCGRLLMRLSETDNLTVKNEVHGSIWSSFPRHPPGRAGSVGSSYYSAVTGNKPVIRPFSGSKHRDKKTKRNSVIADKPRDAFVQHAVPWLTQTCHHTEYDRSIGQAACA